MASKHDKELLNEFYQNIKVLKCKGANNTETKQRVVLRRKGMVLIGEGKAENRTAWHGRGREQPRKSVAQRRNCLEMICTAMAPKRMEWHRNSIEKHRNCMELTCKGKALRGMGTAKMCSEVRWHRIAAKSPAVAMHGDAYKQDK